MNIDDYWPMTGNFHEAHQVINSNSWLYISDYQLCKGLLQHSCGVRAVSICLASDLAGQEKVLCESFYIQKLWLSKRMCTFSLYSEMLKSLTIGMIKKKNKLTKFLPFLVHGYM